MKIKTMSLLLAATCLTAPAYAAATEAADATVQTAGASAAAAAASPIVAAAAQTTAAPAAEAAPRPVTTVVVTGSSIRRQVTESALPLQVFTPAELAREGVSNPEQFVALLTANGTGLDNLASNVDVVAGAARGNNGASSANLRGQGSAGTLVLLNGRRVAAHGLNGGSVDVNQIPLAAIQRIDVLKDGASAIYGTDAIGGVINFITRTDFEGLNVNAFYDMTEAGGGDILRGSILAGYGDLEEQGFNLMASVSYSETKELRGDQRDFVNGFQSDRGLSIDTRGTPFATIFPLNGTTAIPSTLFGPTTPAGAVVAPFLPGSTTVRALGGVNVLDLPGGAGCASIPGMAAYDEVLWGDPSRAFACSYDTSRAAVLQQPLETLTYLARGVLRLGAHEISAEVTGSDADSSRRFSELQLSPNTTTQNFAYPRNAITAPVYDRIFQQLVTVFPTLAARNGLPIAARWRCMECGRRQIDTNTKTSRYFVGVDGPLPFLTDWTYRIGASQAKSESQSLLGGGYYFRNSNAALGVTGLIDVLNTGVVNIFLRPGETQSEAALAAIRSASANGTILFGGEFTVTQYDASASGPLFDLPGGKAYAAIGVDVRKEEYAFNGDRRAAAARPFILGAPFDDANALAGVSRDVQAIYAELLLPLIEGLELTLAVRRDDYSGFGESVNPKVSFKYRPIDTLMFRGSYNTGFRVPTFNQIFNGVTISPIAGADLADPQTCPGGRPNPTVAGCAVINPDIATGGKLDLGPETAEQFSFGLVLTPFRGLEITADWWSIEREDTIRTPQQRELVDNFTLFPERFIRNAAGQLTLIDGRVANLGGSITQGFEFSARYAGELGAGRFSTGIDGSLLTRRKDKLLPNSPYGPSLIGVFSFGGDLGLRWKHNAFFTYSGDDWSASISQLFREGYQNQQLPGVRTGAVRPPNAVVATEDYVTYNLSGTYTGLNNVTITAGIKNLFDTDPPFAITYDSDLGSGGAWDPRVADPRGRAFTLSLGYRF